MEGGNGILPVDVIFELQQKGTEIRQNSPTFRSSWTFEIEAGALTSVTARDRQ
jgi:hypothetical protein